MKNAFVEEKGDVIINPALVKLSSGDLPLPATIAATFLGNSVMQFTWDVAFDCEKANKGDQIMMLAAGHLPFIRRLYFV